MVDMKLVDKINKKAAVLEMPDGAHFRCDCGSELFMKTDHPDIYACAACKTLYRVTKSESSDDNG